MGVPNNGVKGFFSYCGSSVGTLDKNTVSIMLMVSDVPSERGDLCPSTVQDWSVQ